MKTIAVVLALLATACEHDPRYERHVDKRPEPAPAVSPTSQPAEAAEPLAPAKTIERPLTPKIVPLDKRTHRHHRQGAAPHVGRAGQAPR